MMNNKNNVFAKMADYLYQDDALKKAYLRGCANAMTLIHNLMDTTVKMEDLSHDDEHINDIKALNVMIHNTKALTERDIKMCKTLDMPIKACNFSPRTCNGLTKSDIKTVKDLLEKIPNGNFDQIKGFGKKCITEINEFLNDHNLYFGMMNEPFIIEKYAIFKWK